MRTDLKQDMFDRDRTCALLRVVVSTHSVGKRCGEQFWALYSEDLNESRRPRRPNGGQKSEKAVVTTCSRACIYELVICIIYTVL